MKFNESLSGPKITPELLVGLTIGFVVIILIIKASI
jgi:preprotein translocase subunit Sec61beta